MTGNRVAHPLLISLANLDMDFRSKVSKHAFLLLALLPVPKFIHPDRSVHGVLDNRLFHECVDIAVEPLKIAARIGVMMSDPLGWNRHCYTPLVICIVDTPESAMIACVAGKTSSVTMADYTMFGDNFQHAPRTAAKTLRQLQLLESKVDPWGDLLEYVKAAKKEFRLNGSHKPFWRDWLLSEPHLFLSPEPLHHWNKFAYDHDVKWSVAGVGKKEIDFRFSVLHRHVGIRHFKEGISALKQVTGREHRNIQRSLVGVIAGAVPVGVLIAIRALHDFRYRAQSRKVDDENCENILEALGLFHEKKSAILSAGVRQGKGNRPIDNWYIPKLEFMQSVVPNIRANGCAIQWTADVTEHYHITEVKDPARASNNQSYEGQICRYLDRLDKLRRFDLATSIHEANIEFTDLPLENSASNGPSRITSTTQLLERIQPVSTLAGNSRTVKNYFEDARRLQQGDFPNAPTPFRTFSTECTAIHLSRDQDFKQLTIEEVAEKFEIPDLRSALADYLKRVQVSGSVVQPIGGRRTASTADKLPFSRLKVWTSVRIQNKAFHFPDEVLEAQTVAASPISNEWPAGHYDAVLVNIDPRNQEIKLGLDGKSLV
jgi:hypothetical protein